MRSGDGLRFPAQVKVRYTDGTWHGQVIGMPGVEASGGTEDEMRANLIAAMKQHLSDGDVQARLTLTGTQIADQPEPVKRRRRWNPMRQDYDR